MPRLSNRWILQRIRDSKGSADSQIAFLKLAVAVGVAADLEDNKLEFALDMLRSVQSPQVSFDHIKMHVDSCRLAQRNLTAAIEADDFSILQGAIAQGRFHELREDQMREALRRLDEMEPPTCAICLSDELPAFPFPCCGGKSLESSMICCGECHARILSDEGEPRCPFC